MLVFLFIIIGLIIWFFVAKQFKAIAEMKGHDGSPYFWWTFLLGIVGILMVIALPDITNRKLWEGLIEKLAQKSIDSTEKNGSHDNRVKNDLPNNTVQKQNSSKTSGEPERSPETLKEYLNRALQYETDKDVVNYIQGLYTKMSIPGLSINLKPAEKDVISQLINVPTVQLRGRIEQILKTL